MFRISTYLICILFLADQVSGQVIYERTYPNAFPSMKNAIQLSDFSTASFANNATCYFAGWRHISPSGSIIAEGGLADESTHSLEIKQVAEDSVLFSCRVGPLDFDGLNYFKVGLWTPDSIYTLVLDTVQYKYWEDNSGQVRYDAFSLVDNHVLYQRGDTIFSENILTGQVDFQETFFHITHVYPVQGGLMIFSAGLPPTLFNHQIEPIKTWLNIPNHPISFNDMVALDSFIVGINVEMPTALHAVNAFNENSQDIDLSAYFSQIDSLLVRGDILIVTGRNGETRFALKLDKHLNIISGAPFVVPEGDYPWVLSIYPDRLYAWRTDGSGNYRIAYPFVDPLPITYVDLALVDISVDSIFKWSPDQGSPYIVILDLSIVNRSEDTLHNLTILYHDEPLHFCDPGIYPTYHDSLETAPGDTVNLKKWVVVWASDINKPLQKTFFVEHGNNHLDSNRTDNVFEFNEIISNTEESIISSAVVFPNPFTDFLVVSDYAESVQLFLFDQRGQLVAKGTDQLYDLRQLPTGMYFLQIQTGKSIATRRVVKVMPN